MKSKIKILAFGRPIVLGFFALGGASESAEAAKNVCRFKYERCQQRCARATVDLIISCIDRTCNRQFDNCVASGTGGTRK